MPIIHEDKEWGCKFISAEDEKDIIEVIDSIHSDIKETKIVAFDFETSKITGDDDEDVNPFQDSILSCSFCAREDTVYAFRLMDENEWIWNGEVVKKIKDLYSYLFNKNITKVIHNVKFDLKLVWRILDKIPLPDDDTWEDTMVLSYLLDENTTSKLKFTANRYLEIDANKYEREINSLGNISKLKEIDWFVVSRYNCADSFMTRKLYFKLRELAEQEGVLTLYEKLYLGFLIVLLETELTGFEMDVDYIKKKSKEYKVSLEEIEKFFREFTKNPEFNPRSHDQKRKVLVDLGLDRYIKKKTKKSKKLSTDKETMESLEKYDDSGFVSNFLNYGRKEKERQFFDGFLERLDGRILRSSFLPHGTKTGRLSSQNPNFQNLIRGWLLKNAFVAKKGKKLIIADFNQEELRVTAFRSDDESMLEVYRKGGDIHSRTARVIFNPDCDESEIKEKYPTERYIGKKVNFAVLYGMTAESLAKEIKRSADEAQSFINAYFGEFKGVKRYIEEIYEIVIKNEYVENVFGRKRRFPGLNHMSMKFGSNNEAVAKMLREAFNFTIQSTAVDICDLSIVKIKRRAYKEKINFPLLCQVHDEMIWEVDEDKVDDFSEIIKEETYEIVEGLATPIDIEICDKWGDAYDKERI
jgi:DNA polymerase-1